jgi:hypothetical protein
LPTHIIYVTSPLATFSRWVSEKLADRAEFRNSRRFANRNPAVDPSNSTRWNNLSCWNMNKKTADRYWLWRGNIVNWRSNKLEIFDWLSAERESLVN